MKDEPGRRFELWRIHRAVADCFAKSVALSPLGPPIRQPLLAIGEIESQQFRRAAGPDWRATDAQRVALLRAGVG